MTGAPTRTPMHRLVIGTRGSMLARAQARQVGERLAERWPGLEIVEEVVSTRGDRDLDLPLTHVDGKGLFTTELENRLLDRSIDVAVHSLKDLPVEDTEGLMIGAVPPRADWRDALVSRTGARLEELRRGAAVGTGSPRRWAQLLRRRPDIEIVALRGNIETRLRKLADPEGPYDAIVVACAALERLEWLDAAAQVLEGEVMLPAPGQGALGVQCAPREEVLALLRPLNDPATAVAVAAERGFLLGLGGGCALPVAALGTRHYPARLYLQGRVLALAGGTSVEVDRDAQLTGDLQRDMLIAGELGAAAGAVALSSGGQELLEMAEAAR